MCRSRDAGSRIGEISAGKRVIGTTTAIDTPGTRAAGNAVTTTMTTTAITTTTAGATEGGITTKTTTVSDDRAVCRPERARGKVVGRRDATAGR
jgi:hypothetical protein